MGFNKAIIVILRITNNSDSEPISNDILSCVDWKWITPYVRLCISRNKYTRYLYKGSASGGEDDDDAEVDGTVSNRRAANNSFFGDMLLVLKFNVD